MRALAGVLVALVRALDRPGATYARATPRIPRAASAVTRAYARFWQRLPFARMPAPGYGLYAVNPAGRARWGAIPDLIADDTVIRLQVLPDERIQMPEGYDWPKAGGFAALVRVRRRLDQGMRQIAALHLALMAREGRTRLSAAAITALALGDPAGFVGDAAVSLAVRLRRAGPTFIRGR